MYSIEAPEAREKTYFVLYLGVKIHLIGAAGAFLYPNFPVP